MLEKNNVITHMGDVKQDTFRYLIHKGDKKVRKYQKQTGVQSLCNNGKKT